MVAPTRQTDRLRPEVYGSNSTGSICGAFVVISCTSSDTQLVERVEFEPTTAEL